MSTLLGFLARFNAIGSQGELSCTRGLEFLLKDPTIRARFAAWLSGRTNVPVVADLTWVGEQRQADGGRPDLEARTADGVVRVKIEAKLGALLSDDQVASYANHLPAAAGVALFVVLVPERRSVEARLLLTRALPPAGSGTPGEVWSVASGVTVAIVSWEDLFDALRGTGAPQADDLAQLADLYKTLMTREVAPIADESVLMAWWKDPEEYNRLSDIVTRLMTGDARPMPFGRDPVPDEPESSERLGYRRRYVCRPRGPASTCLSIGARAPFRGHTTPLWLRVHCDTPGFDEIRARLRASRFGVPACLVESEGHVWLPLHVPLAQSEDKMVKALVEQAEEIGTFVFPRAS